MDDSSEFTFFQKKIGSTIEDIEIQNFKSSHFITSTCKYSDNRINSERMWNDYADNSKGVAIELEVNESILWKYNFFIGEIQYLKNELPTDIKELKNRHEAFEKKMNMTINTLPKTLDIISSFYKKHENFAHEEEVRIMKNIPKHIPHDLHYHKEVEYLYDSSKNQTNYFSKLALESKSEQEPKISIKRIHMLSETYNKINYRFIKGIKFKFKESFNRELEIELI